MGAIMSLLGTVLQLNHTANWTMDLLAGMVVIFLVWGQEGDSYILTSTNTRKPKPSLSFSALGIALGLKAFLLLVSKGGGGLIKHVFRRKSIVPSWVISSTLLFAPLEGNIIGFILFPVVLILIPHYIVGTINTTAYICC